ncbi:MAG: hypothetical protein QM495_03645 [Lutibacter sp.]|uniref:hypothetical protein n=1 Tax=Lutibacter sp. TaxID=1925666 RepID=UPI003858DD0E
MSKSIAISFVFLFFSSILFAQKNINSYKYILVPKQYEFQKFEDQHQLNSLTKFLFNRAGYSVLFTDDNYPEDLAKNSCLALKVNINSSPGLFKTRMNIDLLDCYNKIVYSTKQAFSKQKEYKKAYQEAIRLTFIELEEFEYSYNENISKNNSYKEPKKTVIVAENNIPIEVKEIKIKKEKKLVQLPVIEKKIALDKENKTNKLHQKTVSIKVPKKTVVTSIEGKFVFENWGISTILKKGNNYIIVGGDENFEFATIYKTSKRTLFIIKWIAYKQPQLVELNSDGNLVIDTKNEVKIYKRVD